MFRKRLINIILFGIRQFRDPYYQGFAAQLAFYFMLSIVPVIIVLSQLLSVFSISLEYIYEYIEPYFSESAMRVLGSIMGSAPSGGLSIVLIVVALWAASKVQFSLMRIANYTFDNTRSGYIRERLRAVLTVLVTVFTIAFSLIILVYGEVLLDLIVSILTTNTTVQYTVSRFWLFLRWPIAMALYFLMVSINYYVLPAERLRFREILPGGIFASISMLVMTILFTAYTNNIANYNVIYGSLASVVVLMIWFLLMSYSLGLGIILNRAWRDASNFIS